MMDSVEIARLLDILGNRNRRRIIELLREKPCFVTEISDRLTLSPKAVIDHLQMMEREEILAFRMDDRRRKYYYLSNDILVRVSLQKQDDINERIHQNAAKKFCNSLVRLQKMVETRDELLKRLENFDHDIDEQVRKISREGKKILGDEHELDLVIALSHYPLSVPDLVELTGRGEGEIIPALKELEEQGIIEQSGPVFRICENYAG